MVILMLSVLFVILVAIVAEDQTTGNANTALTGEAAERFAHRDVEKFKFLGE